MSKGPVALLKSAARALILAAARQAERRPHLKRLGRALLVPVPAFGRRVRAIAALNAPLPPRRMHVPLDSNDLSPATQALYRELKSHFERRQS